MELIIEEKGCNISAWEYTYLTLRKNILYLNIRPGESISENKLAAELNISRSPVRDAIAKLASDGLIEVYPQRGSIISHLSRKRITEFLFMRTSLEYEVMKQAGTQGFSAEVLDLLEESLQNQHKWLNEKKLNEVLEEDYHMHRIIYQTCEKEFVWDSYQTLNSDHIRIRYLKLATPYYQSTMLPATSWDNTLTEHRMLIDSIRRRDGDAACRLADQHINQLKWDVDNLQSIFPHYFQR